MLFPCSCSCSYSCHCDHSSSSFSSLRLILVVDRWELHVTSPMHSRRQAVSTVCGERWDEVRWNGSVGLRHRHRHRHSHSTSSKTQQTHISMDGFLLDLSALSGESLQINVTSPRTYPRLPRVDSSQTLPRLFPDASQTLPRPWRDPAVVACCCTNGTPTLQPTLSFSLGEYGG